MSQVLDVVGDFRVTSGLGTAAARLVDALSTAGMSIRQRHYAQGVSAAERARGSQLGSLPEVSGRSSAVELWCLNASEMVSVPAHQVRRDGVQHVIGMWAWEAPEVPPSYAEQLDKVDEVWVPSTFTQRAIQALTSKPVVCVPNVVPRPADVDALTRADLPIADDQVVFLFTFDTWAGLARKNVFGLLDAYQLARATCADVASRVTLVLKGKNLDHYPSLRRLLLARAASLGIHVVEENLPRADMDRLLARCDVYVSLHRAEGFGLGMAEAASMGKAVIATGYSGNLDFQSALTTLLIGYRLRRVGAEDIALHPEGPFTTDMHWAEPSLADAARAMSLLAQDARSRSLLGDRARALVQARCGAEGVAAVARRRLQEIHSALKGSD